MRFGLTKIAYNFDFRQQWTNAMTDAKILHCVQLRTSFVKKRVGCYELIERLDNYQKINLSRSVFHYLLLKLPVIFRSFLVL